MSSNGTSNGSGVSMEPFVWVVVPLIAIFSVGTLVVFMWNRHRKGRRPYQNAWPEGRVVGGGSSARNRRGTRWSPWAGTRSVEGLNELGEAPPPYDPKNPPPTQDPSGQRREDTGEEGSEMRDLEAGVQPPEYLAHPPPAVVTGSRIS